MTISASAKHKPEMSQVIELFRERKIETRREAETTIQRLSSQGKASTINGLERLGKTQYARNPNRQISEI